jgi:hypothetical protein
MVLTSKVLPNPGTPSKSTLPPAKRAIRVVTDYVPLADYYFADLGLYLTGPGCEIINLHIITS